MQIFFSLEWKWKKLIFLFFFSSFFFLLFKENKSFILIQFYMLNYFILISFSSKFFYRKIKKNFFLYLKVAQKYSFDFNIISLHYTPVILIPFREIIIHKNSSP